MPTQEPSRTAPEIVRRLATAHFVSQAVYVVAKLDLAEALAEGPKTASELAYERGLHEEAVFRVMRALTDADVFVLNGDRYALTEVGHCLRSGVPNSMRSAAILFGEEVYRACGDLLETIRTGETAFDRVYGMGHFEYLAEHPDAARTFHEAMTELTTVVVEAVINTYDFSTITKLVDVGGGEGLFLANILAANQHLQGVLFELPPALLRTKALLDRFGVAERCEIISGNFFEAVCSGGDAYLLKSVIHDWDDSDSITILRNSRQAMPVRGLLLVVERVIPEGSEPFFGRLNDIVMLTVSGGRERTGAEYARLLSESGFELSGIYPTGSGFHIVEAIAV